MNKVDLVPPAELSTLSALIYNINPAAPIFQTIRGNIELKRIMDIRAYNSGPSLAWEPALESFSPNAHARDLQGIHSIQLRCPTLTPLQLKRLDEWIHTVLWENRVPSNSLTGGNNLHVLRCKGAFAATDGKQYILQGVQNLYEITEVYGRKESFSEEGKIVIIGKGVNDEMKASLEDIWRR